MLQEAARLFRKRGYAGTSIRELSTAVGIQSATLYHYMKTKEDLLAAVCDRGYELIISAVTRAAQDAASPLDALEAIIHAHLHASIEHIVPRTHGGDDSPENLALACARCNQEKGIHHDSKSLTDPRRLELQSRLQRVGHTDVQGSVAPACQNVDVIHARNAE